MFKTLISAVDRPSMSGASDLRQVYDAAAVKSILAPVNLGLGAVRHVAWYVSYQIAGTTREG